MTPKPLPTIISKEIELPVDYAVIRSMTTKKAISNVTLDGTAKVWFKVVSLMKYNNRIFILSIKRHI